MIPLLEARGLTKTYGQLRANDDVSFSIFPGEIVGIVGENGAGKSTLVKMLGGAVEPDSGDIYVSGERITMRSPADAKQAGISLVHQHFKLIEALTVEENLVLGRPELRHGILDFKALRPGFRASPAISAPSFNTTPAYRHCRSAAGSRSSWFERFFMSRAFSSLTSRQPCCHRLNATGFCTSFAVSRSAAWRRS